MNITWQEIEEALGALKISRPLLELAEFLNPLIETARLKAIAREPVDVDDLVKVFDELVNTGIELESNEHGHRHLPTR